MTESNADNGKMGEPSPQQKDVVVLSADQRQDLRHRLRVVETTLLNWEKAGTPSSIPFVHRFNLELGSLFIDVIAAGLLPPAPEQAAAFDGRRSWYDNDAPFIHPTDHVAAASKGWFTDPDEAADVHERWYTSALRGDVPGHPSDQYHWLAMVCRKLNLRLNEPPRPEVPSAATAPADHPPAESVAPEADHDAEHLQDDRSQIVSPDGKEMVTVQVAAAVCKLEPGHISRLVDKGKIASNGLKRAKRRVDLDSTKAYARSRSTSERMVTSRIKTAKGKRLRDAAQLRNPQASGDSGRLRSDETLNSSWDRDDSE